MDSIVSVMMDLIASEVCGKTIDNSQFILTDEEIATLYKLSKSHDLAHLVGDALIKNNLIPEDEIKSKFEKQMMLAVCRFEWINYELSQIKEKFNEEKIPFIPLKGSEMRQYYPEPWMRTSCDIDVLVKKTDHDRAVKLMTETMGYTAESKNSHDVGLYSSGGIHVELHYTLIESQVVGIADKVLESVWDLCSPESEGSYYYKMPDDLFYYYHIAHMAKHYVHGGCGVRSFIDIWVLNHLKEYNKEHRNSLLANGGLLTFASYAEALSDVWFCNAEHNDITRQMESYLLHGGIYGTVNNRVKIQQIKQGGKMQYMISRIWIPYNTLKYRYPSLEGKKILLPFYEVCRWCNLIFCGTFKRGINELKINSATTLEEQESTKLMLKNLGLDI